MREIKFRGQRLDKSEFVYGDLIHGVGSKKGRTYILPNKVNLAYVKDCHPLDGVEVIPESVGEYTGLKDKNGKEIYEGDIIVASTYPFQDNGKSNYVATVEWLFSSWQYVLHCVNRNKRGISSGMNQPLQDEHDIQVNFEVIGNIYENTDLIK